MNYFLKAAVTNEIDLIKGGQFSGYDKNGNKLFYWPDQGIWVVLKPIADQKVRGLQPYSVSDGVYVKKFSTYK